MTLSVYFFLSVPVSFSVVISCVGEPKTNFRPRCTIKILKLKLTLYFAFRNEIKHVYSIVLAALVI